MISKSTHGPHAALAPRRGYTLFELVLTLLIIGIIAAIAVPTVGQSMGQPRLKTAANLVAADIEFVMSECISRPDARRTIIFDTGSNRYYVLDASNTVITNPGDGLPYENDFATGRTASFKGVTLVSCTVNGNPVEGFSFTPYGRPDTTHDVLITLAYDTQQMRITVTKASGAISIARLN